MYNLLYITLNLISIKQVDTGQEGPAVNEKVHKCSFRYEDNF